MAISICFLLIAGIAMTTALRQVQARNTLVGLIATGLTVIGGCLGVLAAPQFLQGLLVLLLFAWPYLARRLSDRRS